LSWAAENGHEETVKLLLTTINIDAQDMLMMTPFDWAATNNHEAMVNLLLATGKVDIKTKDTSDRALLS
jgi:ankyrin repeat protein